MKTNKPIFLICFTLTLVMFFTASKRLLAEQYEYDALGRLTNVIYDDRSSITYTYDRAGNIVRIQQQAALLAGDVSGDNRVTALDALLVLRFSVGLIEFSPAQQEAADVTNDGTISALDAVHILWDAAGLITQSPEQSLRGKSLSRAMRSYSASQRTVTLDAMETDGNVTVPVFIDEAAGVMSVELTLRYNPNAMTFIDIKAASSDYQFQYSVKEDSIQIAAIHQTPPSGSTPLFFITFESSGKAGAMTSLAVKKIQANEGRIPVRVLTISK